MIDEDRVRITDSGKRAFEISGICKQVAVKYRSVGIIQT